ncbi:cell division protein FtsQ/DivIB [Neiella sp. HB171785]|uniref:Cell division protein FtsQ n=1 Tax=Neiella litorisoli TaxID=2771431 RepID=A0A8J6QRA2_9GAMM|nr:cell division protein FtsQ/DivIB [Neiella litorisoli]MBD1389961.1 cell division protein FtsQ/DivIB [Neiella litorisoli]
MTVGASQAQRLPEWEFWFGVAFFLVTLVGGLYLAYGAAHVWSDRAALPVQHLRLHGDRRFVSDEMVTEQLLAQGPLPSLTQLDVDWVQQQVVALPWVNKAAVRKEWPDQLSVHVTEFEPVMRWSDSRLVSDQGELFAVPDTSVVAQLPLIEAADELVGDTMSMLAATRAATDKAGLQVIRMKVTSRQAWTLWLANGIELRLGREQTLARFERFLALYPELINEQRSTPQYVDLRYDTGAAVKWPDQTEEGLAEQDGKE